MYDLDNMDSMEKTDSKSLYKTRSYQWEFRIITTL